MGLFGKKKSRCGSGCGCDCGSGKAETAVTKKKAETVGASVKILGSGCAKCNQLEANTVEALKILGMDTAIEHVTDFGQIAAYGVMSTPALVVDGKVVAYGTVCSTDDVVKILQKISG